MGTQGHAKDVVVLSGKRTPFGTCGGSLIMGKRAPLAIYCTDKDNDAKDQQGIMSDLGILKKGEMLILNASPHFGVESPGSWKLQSLVLRPFAE